MFGKSVVLFTALVINSWFSNAAVCTEIDEPRYEANWQSLDTRPNPQWYRDARFGIFIHWGLYSVPSWGGKGSYAEWYLKGLQAGQGLRHEWHHRVYGPEFSYRDFSRLFKAENFEPDQWADLFARSGARYVVLTSKHHDGFCLWPNPQSNGYNSAATAAGRDLIGDLSAAVRARDLRMGLYFSLFEWDHPLYPEKVDQYVDQYLVPQFKDLVNRYRPALIFADGEWDHGSATWRSEEMLAWLYNESPAPRDVVVNDRWGGETRFKHGGYYSTEYEGVGEQTPRRFIERGWEECRGIGSSFGYNRNEDIEDYATSRELVRLLVEIVARGGNLLLNVGPTADGRIPVIMQERLLAMGDWLAINGEAIYGTRVYRRFDDGADVRFTRSADKTYVYAVCLEVPGSEVHLPDVQCREDGHVVLLAGEGAPTNELEWQNTADGLLVHIPEFVRWDLSREYPSTIRIEAVPWVERPRIVVESTVAVDQPLLVELRTVGTDAELFYSLDGAEPTPESLRYCGPFEIEKSAFLQVRAFRSGWSSSLVTSDFLSVADSDINGLAYRYFEGTWENLAEMIADDPVKQGRVYEFDLAPVIDRDDEFGVEYTGEIELATAGRYVFSTVSDDGSGLWIDGDLIVDNDGLHGPRRVEGSADLDAGRHTIEVRFFECGGGEVLEVRYRKPGGTEQPIPAAVLFQGHSR